MSNQDASRQFAIQGIAHTMRTRRDSIIALLRKHGVIIDQSYDDPAITIAVLKAVGTSPRFRGDLSKLMADAASEGKKSFTGREGFFQFTGREGFFGFTGKEGFFNFGPTDEELAGATSASSNTGGSTTTSTTSATKTNSALSGLLTGNNLSNLFNTGLNVLSTTVSAKSNQKLADTALQIEQAKTMQAAYLAGGGYGSTLPGAGMSTGAKVAIGVLVLGVLGTVTYFIVRKKK
jgi:hypothetical protein